MKRIAVLSFIIGLLGVPIQAQAQSVRLQPQGEITNSLIKFNQIQTQNTINLMRSMNRAR